MPKKLTENAQDDRDEFDSYYADESCTCHIHPPCGKCTHPGNPLNQEDDESCWESYETKIPLI